MADKDLKFAIQSSIKAFTNEDISKNALALFSTLGYNTDRQSPFENKTYQTFKESFLDGETRFNEGKAIVNEWKSVDLLFQLSKEEITLQRGLFDTKKVKWEGEDKETVMETYLFFAIELEKTEYTRTVLAQITREVNKVFPMPVMLVFKHGKSITLSVINRRIHKKDERRDVLEKVTLIKDISIENPHRAHIEILFDLSFNELQRNNRITNFVELHNAWQKTLDTKELNKRFYRELSNWYFWAMKEATFPGASLGADHTGVFKQEDKVREHNATNLIRLLTRILFIWFFKEKNLIPEELFDESYIKGNLINSFEPKKKYNFDHETQGSKYYRAILQNMFFATLNQTMGKREFRKEGQHRNVTNLMRYESYFKDPKAFIKLVEDVVPFMNGGLFECLDKPAPELKGKKGGDVIIYEDGFSDRPDNKLCVPDYIFFDTGEHADLSEELGDKRQKDVAVKGLINILKSYKFTVTENTPIEEDIALDPELLGRVFENLLASYNPETKTTARKQTGSFYTPREIVNYMVDESIKAYLKQKLETEAGMDAEDAEIGLEFLIGYYDKENLFDEKQTAVLINAIDTCKILDPACGSGAFPMGILHKLVHILHKLDPNNEKWREIQRQKAIKETEDVFKIGNKQEREDRLKEINDVFENNSDDYGRKLYLIENCIYGVDIQPVATQISKLRFFISLIVDQKTDKTKDNFGIRPLPNLETKFVAANTLIGIEKPQKGTYAGSLFDNKAVNELEEKLKDIRHRLFSAKTPATKRKLREEDQKLREKMGEILTNSGWDNETARQLAAWDPYDQNASSPFFDPEWMFGVSEGVDVVIGNPPYVRFDKIGSKFSKYLFANYNTAVQKCDIYNFFIENSLNITRNNGYLAFIVSSSWLSQHSFNKLRKFLLENFSIKIILKTPKNTFEKASVATLILLVEKNKSENNIIKMGDYNFNNEITNLYYIKQNFYKQQNNYLIYFNEEAKQNTINRAFIENTIQLEKIVKLSFGIMTGDDSIFTYHGIKHQIEDKKVLRGGNIKKYYVKWTGEYVWYNPFEMKLYKETARPGTPERFEDEKIIIKREGAGTITASLDRDNYYTIGSTFIINKKDKNYHLNFILALLNSKLISYWYGQKFRTITQSINSYT